MELFGHCSYMLVVISFTLNIWIQNFDGTSATFQRILKILPKEILVYSKGGIQWDKIMAHLLPD